MTREEYIHNRREAHSVRNYMEYVIGCHISLLFDDMVEGAGQFFSSFICLLESILVFPFAFVYNAVAYYRWRYDGKFQERMYQKYKDAVEKKREGLFSFTQKEDNFEAK